MHLVETMAYAGEKPWHGLGKRLEAHQSIDVWKVHAGMNWQIEESEVRYISSKNNVGVINAFLSDGNGLVLWISPAERKSRRVRYRLPDGSCPALATVGHYPEMSLPS